MSIKHIETCAKYFPFQWSQTSELTYSANLDDIFIEVVFLDDVVSTEISLREEGEDAKHALVSVIGETLEESLIKAKEGLVELAVSIGRVLGRPDVLEIIKNAEQPYLSTEEDLVNLGDSVDKVLGDR